MSNEALLTFDIIFSCKSIEMSIEMDHMKPPLIHEFFCIQSIELIPLQKFKEVILDAQYKKCKNNIKNPWYSLTHEAFLSLRIR